MIHVIQSDRIEINITNGWLGDWSAFNWQWSTCLKTTRNSKPGKPKCFLEQQLHQGVCMKKFKCGYRSSPHSSIKDLPGSNPWTCIWPFGPCMIRRFCICPAVGAAGRAGAAPGHKKYWGHAINLIQSFLRLYIPAQVQDKLCTWPAAHTTGNAML